MISTPTFLRTLRRVLCISALLMCCISAQATNLRLGRVIAPNKAMYVSNLLQAMQVFCRNDSTYDARNFTVICTLFKLYPTMTVLMSETIKVALLAKRDSVLLTTEKKWAPADTGTYKVEFSVNYIDDVIPSDNNLSMNFNVVNPPLGYAKIGQFDFESPFSYKNSSLGLFTATLPPSVSTKYVNVVAYPPAHPNGYWLVQNMVSLPDPADTTNVSQYVNYADMGYKRGVSVDSISLFYSVSDVGWSSKLDISLQEKYRVADLNYHMCFTQDSVVSPLDTSNYTPPPLEWMSPVTVSRTVHRATMPNIDLDSSTHNPNTVAGYAGDKNACVPASAANSLHWLEMSHPRIDSTQGLRGKLVELSALLNRERERGATALELIQAKLAYIDKYKLPIHVKFQSFYISMDSMVIKSPDTRYGHTAVNKSDTTFLFPRPSSDFVLSEMQNGEDVECIVGWYNLNETARRSQRRYGHAFTLSGSGRIDGNPFIVKNDDNDQKRAGGTARIELMLDDSSDIGGPVIPSMGFVDLDGARLTCILESVVSESYDSTIAFNTSGINADDPSRLHCSILNNDSKTSSLIIETQLAGLGSYRVFDSKGALVYESPSFILQQGKNVFSLEGTTQLAHGMYYVHTVTTHGEATTTLLK